MIFLLLTIVAALGLITYVAYRSAQTTPSDREEGRPRTDPETTAGIVVEVPLGRTMRRSSARPADLPVDPDDVWIQPGQSVSVGGFTIPGGMLYVGERLPAVNEWRGVEPALINPRLPVAAVQPDHDGAGLPYWPSYSEIPPASRTAYLIWLASGRETRKVAIGYVFLFLYGLERRLLADARQGVSARTEREQLIAEVQRLLNLYGDQRSFRRYASALLDTIRIQTAVLRLYNAPPPQDRSGYELPLALRVGLAQLVADGKPIPGAWAWSWLACSPEVSLRTPAERCPEEFRLLFVDRYVKKFGTGMSVKPNKTKLKVAYQPASPSFGAAINVPVGDLPDITAISGPIRRLQEIADACAEDLDPYSRWIGRNPEGRGSLEAAALLPPELVDSTAHAAVRPLRDWVESKLKDSSSVVVPAAELLRFWPQAGEKLAKADAVSLAQILARIGCGVEPDVRFGAPPLAADAPAVLFRLPEQSPAAASPAYGAATLLLHIGASVATADGTVTAEEERQLESQLESALHLAAAERTRLRAHLAWLLAAQPGMAGLKKRVETLAPTQRRSIGRYLVAVAGADGHFDPSEVTALTKMYRLLGFTATEAYSDVHSLASTAMPPAAEPVTVRGATAATGFAIPPPPDAPDMPRTTTLSLDMARVEATLAETKAVAALLTDIFTDDEETTPVRAQATTAGDRLIEGLDAPHTAMVHALAERGNWTRAEFEGLAQRHGLLPDGALDTINEAALDQAGVPLCEGDDPVVVDATVAKELMG